MDEILAVLDDLQSEGQITMAARLVIEKALLRLHVASPPPPITHGPTGRMPTAQVEEVETIYVCGKCGTHYVDQY